KVNINSVTGSTDIPVNDIHFDSRKVSLDDVFVAIKGTASDGHNFIVKAVESGAIAVICEEIPDTIINGITYIKVEDSHAALAVMASNFYGTPSKNLRLVGITGTNGKTTIATLLHQLFKKAGYKVGLLSTVKVIVDDKEFNATHTTPDSLTINGYLKMIHYAGVKFFFMLVSLHGIHQKRTAVVVFSGCIFTILSHGYLVVLFTFK